MRTITRACRTTCRCCPAPIKAWPTTTGPDKHQFDSDNLAAQLDEAGIPWRVYMEDMGEPCLMRYKGHYAVRHNPFVYLTSVTGDRDKCREHVVDMDEHLSADLGASEYRYMWITPNECNDMHDCGPGRTDDWLAELVPQIMASDGYRNGGAIFFLWDEGGQDASYVFGGKQVIPAIVVSDRLSSPGFVPDILYSHDSYLATVEDALGLPRLPSTQDSPPMQDFFSAVSDEAADPATDASAQ